jgi:hypothetical protein
MVQYKLRFHAQIVGPYGLFSDESGQFTVGREVNASSHSSEVSEFISKAPRFSSIGEVGGFSFSVVGDDVPVVAEIKEYVNVQDIDFNYDGDVDEPMYMVAKVFYAVINVFGEWKDFVRYVRSASGTINMDIGFDEDGMDYERLAEYSVKLLLVGGEAERLMKLEGISLWSQTLREES